VKLLAMSQFMHHNLLNLIALMPLWIDEYPIKEGERTFVIG